MSLTGDYFYDVMVMPDSDEDDPIILEGVEWLVEVLQDGEWADAQVYTNENLSDVVTVYETDESGEIAFWASMGEYRITITDLEDPPRIAPRYIYWMSIPYRDFDALRFAGEIVMTARTVAPDGWLMCDGSAVSRTEYVRLWEAIGIEYGDPGGDMFNLPDLRGRVPVGLGTNASTSDLGQNEGQAENVRKPTHAHTQPEHAHAMPHTHSGSDVGVSGLASSVAGDHSHAYEGGKLIHTRRNVPQTSGDAAVYQFRRLAIGGGSDEYQWFDKQSLYIAGFNAAGGVDTSYDEAASMDTEGAHQHTIDIAAGAVSVGQPSADNVANGGADNTNEMTVPYQVVNFMIRY